MSDDIVKLKKSYTGDVLETKDFLQKITDSMGVPRNILADDKEISYVCNNLPDLLKKLPREGVNPSIVRMCVAARVGLFDCSVNYIWNTAILALRKKLEDFGLAVAKELLSLDKDIKIDTNDAQLLNYCLALNLITETGFFFLDQCRAIRNNYSSAHPVETGEMLDEYGLVSYINNCIKYSFEETAALKGVNLKTFTDNIKSTKFDNEKITYWHEAIKNTNETQKNVIFTRLHTLYCDPSTSETSRNNCLNLFNTCKEFISDIIMTNILAQHNEYRILDDASRIKASRTFYKKTDSMKYLDLTEKNIIISSTVRLLENVHIQFNNFYNEPPIAESLFNLTKQIEVPEASKQFFVKTVVNCSVGNGFGVSDNADFYYEKIIKNFTPAEIKIMINLPEIDNLFKHKIDKHRKCKEKFKILLKSLEPNSIPKSLLSRYEEFTG